MKIQFSFKDPDVMIDEIASAMKTERANLIASGMPEDEADAVVEIRREKAVAACHRWFDYGEYCVVEIDTDADTATVVRPS